MSVYSRSYGNFHGQTVITDSDGYGPPMYGGIENAKFAHIVYTQRGVDVYCFTLPEGAIITRWLVNVKTAFNDSGTDLLDIGDQTTGDRFANDISLATAGQIVTGFDEDELYIDGGLTAETKIIARYTGQNSNATTGEADIAVYYILLNQ